MMFRGDRRRLWMRVVQLMMEGEELWTFPVWSMEVLEKKNRLRPSCACLPPPPLLPPISRATLSSSGVRRPAKLRSLDCLIILLLGFAGKKQTTVNNDSNLQLSALPTTY